MPDGGQEVPYIHDACCSLICFELSSIVLRMDKQWKLLKQDCLLTVSKTRRNQVLRILYYWTRLDTQIVWRAAVLTNEIFRTENGQDGHWFRLVRLLASSVQPGRWIFSWLAYRLRCRWRSVAKLTFETKKGQARMKMIRRKQAGLTSTLLTEKWSEEGDLVDQCLFSSARRSVRRLSSNMWSIHLCIFLPSFTGWISQEDRK
jgi:hypothetical protein